MNLKVVLGKGIGRTPATLVIRSNAQILRQAVCNQLELMCQRI